jgi:ribose/xylose/arabinose/galactoside ABC-type transport system permease subunit
MISYQNRKIKNIFNRILRMRETGIILPLIILLIVIGSVNKDFFAVNNLIDVLRTVSYYFIIAAPLTCLVISGCMDLSIGGVTALGGILCAWCINMGLPLFIAIIAALLIGALVGFLNSRIVVKGKIHSFIATLGTSYVIKGFILITTLGLPVLGFEESFKVLGQGKMLDTIYWTIIAALAIMVIFHLLLSRMKFGRAIYAVGGNEETARLAGINVQNTRTTLYILVSCFSVLTGIFMASRFNSAQPSAGIGTELTILASIIIGGTSIQGGSGSIVGTFFGCCLLSVIKNGLILMHVSSYWIDLIFGAILIVSLFIDKYRRSKSGSNS